jgi:hypothetical protein
MAVGGGDLVVGSEEASVEEAVACHDDCDIINTGTTQGTHVLKEQSALHVDSAQTERIVDVATEEILSPPTSQPNFWRITSGAAKKALDLYFEPLRRLRTAHKNTANRPTL